MGCSPSRGSQLVGAHSPFRRRRALLPASHANAGESDEGVSGGSSAVAETDGKRQATCQQDATVAISATKAVSDGGHCSTKLEPQEITVNILSQLKDKAGENQESGEKKAAKKTKKPIKGVGKVGKKKERDKKATEAKVDFPELLVKAHQAAYSYLNPSITKYEVLLGLLDHAAQTQISLQPMVAFMLMRYEEINRGLEEIVEEGERLLKENGEHLAWPCHLKNLSNTSGKSNASSSPTDPPPDLLQQLLQYTIQRMHHVSHSVGAVGDSALEEAVDYFTSVSDILEEKLKVKRASEARLMRLLTRIEAATLRKPGKEDSALFSEDSGIGAESESPAGSDRQRRRRESSESTGTNYTSASSPMGCSFTPVHKETPRCKLTQKSGSSLSLTSIDSFCNFGKEQRDSECREFLCSSASVEDDEKEEGKEVDPHEGGDSNSNSNPPRRLPSKRIENPQNIEMTLKMREAISGRIKFVSSPKANAKTKQADSPKISRRQWNEEEFTPKRPQTPTPRLPRKKTAVAKNRRTHSADSIRSKPEDPTLLELERTQKDLTQRLDRMSKAEGNIRNTASKQGKGKTQPSSPSTSVRLRPLQKTPQSPSKSPKKTTHGKSSTKEKEIQKEIQKEPQQEVQKGPQQETHKGHAQMESDDSQNSHNDNKINDTEEKDLSKPTPSSPTQQKPGGLNRGRNSVKRLIDTFSHGVEEIKHAPESVKILGPLKGVIKCGVPIIPGLGGADTVLTIGNDNIRADSRASDRAEDIDIDSLPPPPLEVLMDNSYENVQKSETEEGGAGRGYSPLLRRANMSQKLRASMQSVMVLPSRGGVRPGSLSMLPPCPPSSASQQESKPEVDPVSNPASQPKKGLATERTATEQQSLSALGSGGTKQKDISNTSDAVPSTSVSNSQPTATATPRTRMLPSTPATSSSLQRKLPSPPVFKSQPTPPSTSSPPPVTRKLPTPPPASQRRQPSPSAPRQDGNLISTSMYPIKAPSPPASPKVHRWSRENSCATRQDGTPVSANAYPIKAPSPPASPKVQRWSRENSSDDSLPSSRVFSNARSVFCPASPSLFEAKPCPVPRPPQAWTSSTGSVTSTLWGDRVKLPVSRGPNSFIRRSQSDRRPSLNYPPRGQAFSFAETCGSEPSIACQGLEDGPTKDTDGWDHRWELTGAARSASHPDLCIIGQALHPE